MGYIYFNEDHDSIREMARDFADKSLGPISLDVDKNDELPANIVEDMVNFGFLGLKIPEEYGGVGLDMRSYVCVMEEVARRCPAATIYITSANSLSSAPILLFGTEEQKEQYLPGIVDNSAIIAFGLTEPGAGSDAGSLITKAEKNGDEYILNGRKCFITLAPYAKHSIIYAKTSPDKGARGITAFIVDMNLPGVSCGKNEDKMGQRGVPVCDIVLEDVRVPSSCILGEIDKGFTNAMKTLNIGRVGVSAMSLGIAQRALELGVDHIKNRVQFGKPLAKQQGLQFMVAEMEANLAAARLLTYEAAYKMDMGEEDPTLIASIAKYFSTEKAKDIVDKSLQLHGGYGYSAEYEIEKLYRDIRVTTIYEGSTQIQQIVISGQVLR